MIYKNQLKIVYYKQKVTIKQIMFFSCACFFAFVEKICYNTLFIF